MRSDIIAQINTDRLLHNYGALRTCIAPSVKICAILKGNAYGHGMDIVAPTLQAAGADFAGVATLQEAAELRAADWRRPILVLGNVLAVADWRERRERIQAILQQRATITVPDRETVSTLAKTELPAPIDVHLKVDTGMGRMGCLPEDAAGLIRAIQATPWLRLKGIYSHFATADFERLDLARRQLATFQDTLDRVADLLPSDVIRHLANSAATITMTQAHFDMVRPGLALYGYPPAEHMASRIDLKPVLRVVSHLSLIKELPVGHCVGYGQIFTTCRPTKLGLVPIGYSDGYLRALSNLATIGTPVGDAPVVGRISMDQLAVDLTDLPELALGTQVTLFDDDPVRPNSVAATARRLGTIPYEVTCLLGQRIQRSPTGKSCAPPQTERVVTKPQLQPEPMCKTHGRP